MRPAVNWSCAIVLAALVAGCSNGVSLFGDGGSVFNSGSLFGGSSPPPLSPAEEAQEDQKCQSSGYQLNTPAYTYCRGELARQRAIAETAPSVPTMRIAR